jgi:DnaK suppressor protein
MQEVAIRTELLAKRDELMAGLNSREDIRIEQAAEMLDNLQLQLDREVVIRKLDADAALLRKIGSALKRLDEGDFGICVECEKEIPPRRLQVLPWATHCVPCQEKVRPDGQDPSLGFLVGRRLGRVENHQLYLERSILLNGHKVWGRA